MKFCGVCFCDNKQYVDTIDYDILWQKLDIDGHELGWLKIIHIIVNNVFGLRVSHQILDNSRALSRFIFFPAICDILIDQYIDNQNSNISPKMLWFITLAQASQKQSNL